VDADELVTELYGVPPGEFVAARNAKVRELRAAGQRDAAETIAKLRRPNSTEWALNMAARAQPGAVAAWADAADEVRQAQEATAAGRQVDLRASLTTLRARTADMVSAASQWAASDALSLALHEIAASPDATDALRAGVLGAPRAPAGERPAAARDTPRQRRSTRTVADSATREAERGQDRAADRARVAVERAAAEVDEARAAATTAADVQRAAEAELTATTDEVRSARRHLFEAEASQREAEKRQREARRAESDAGKRLARAQRAHDDALARLDKITK
jgi:hypothetical protein